MSYFDYFNYNYLDISNVSDLSFSTPNDSVYNANQYKFYNQVNNSIKKLNKPMNEDLRQVEVNTYYYKRYKSENQILYFIMIICVIIIVIALIKKRVAFLDDLSYSIIVGTILGISLLYIVYSIYLLVYKDNHNYDEDQYTFNNNAIDICNNDINYDCLQHDPEANDV